MNIPAEAIEAAARRLCALAGYDWDTMAAPSDVVEDFRAQLTAQAKSILEAASPHMLVIDDDLWREFQAATATAGTNPSETIRQLVREWVDENKEEAEE